MTPEKTIIISPAYNVSGKIEKVLKGLYNYKSNCLFINDGSTDNTYHLIKDSGFLVINMICNRGVSACILTGLQYALEHDYTYAILIDSDGQHNTDDIELIINQLIHSDAVFANRFTINQNIPSCKITANAFASAIYKDISNHFIPDVSCGYKAFKITHQMLDDLSHAKGYSIIYELVNYCLTQNYNINFFPTQAIYYFENLLSTRANELIALFSSAMKYCQIPSLSNTLYNLFQKVVSRKNFCAMFCNINFHAFYLRKYDSYILQAPLDNVYKFYTQGGEINDVHK